MGLKKRFDFKNNNKIKIKLIKIATLSVVKITNKKINRINNEIILISFIFLKCSLNTINEKRNIGVIFAKKLPNFFSSLKKLVT